MDLENIGQRLAVTGNTIVEALQAISDEQALWKPDENSWSLIEVINHLVDEEKEDFRARLNVLLHEPPGTPLPSIDPEGWVRDRNYADRNLEESVERFTAQRAESCGWLSGLKNPDWTRSVRLPQGYELRAGDLFVSWVAHDLRHLSQIIRLQLAYFTRSADPYTVQYAG